MHSVIKDGGKTFLKGSGESEDVWANDMELTDLDCRELRVMGRFNVSGNPALQSLQNGPKSMRSYIADGCGLESLDCRELEVATRVEVQVNPLRSLRDAPKTPLIYVDDDTPALYAVGRIASIHFGDDADLPVRPLFRFKFDLVTTGRKANAQFTA